jgi:hypothetical protein
VGGGVGGGSEAVNSSNTAEKAAVIPANVGIQVVYLIDFQGGKPYELDSGVRRNEGFFDRRHFFTASQRL